jgi:hypothetical protein
VVPGPACPNPPSVTNIKCALWGSSISYATATNEGQYQDDFHVVIAGSNGYDKTPFVAPGVSVSGFDAPTNISGSYINTSQAGVFLAADFFAGPYNPVVCGAYAVAQTKVNREAAISAGASSYQPCNFFNAFTVYRNSFAVGTYCSLYNAPVDPSEVSNGPVSSGNDEFSVQASWTYALSTQDSGKV